ncbi:YihY/virulence factor BrkB family protein [Microvirga lotononidis]|uniref:Putative membrane protein n=1 Tax=Microvirga lotononidis TaxID=864069 RepID=I4YLW4_9HYPH|nr:YihY/virulence factor BrkB family protein [Microvirga lotononidis]EIM24956.1 putative membrane protein [Microvirga lotononidis]WQO29548.1 YihY/virulence factor BrkB family protein [Microvirga lotononidis]
MADNPAIQQPGARQSSSSSTVTTMWAVVLGWALVRLVASGDRPAPSSPRAGRSSSAPVQARAQARNTGSDIGEKQHAPPHAAAEKGRGRDADTPTEIPARGWKDILWRTYEEFNKDRVLSVAAGVTYYALLAVFPAIAALVSIYGLFADPATIQDHLNTVSGVLPGGALDIIREQVTRIASQGGGTLGFGFIFGLVLSLWSANAGMKAIFDALNIVYGEDEKRSFVHLNALSLSFTLGAIVFILFALAAIIVLPIILRFIGLGSGTEWLVSLSRWPILLIGVTFGLSLIYRFGPSRDKAEWRWVTPGGLVAAVLWLAVSMLFSWYVANFGSYNETYGSLGAVIGFMTWIWLSTTIVLLGAEINAEMEHQTAQDTTEGTDQPMGTRGAQMADTIGVAKS